MELQTQLVADSPDVLLCDRQIPAGIHMEHERSESPLCHSQVEQVATVQTAAEAKDAIILLTFAGFFDFVQKLFQLLLVTLSVIPLLGNPLPVLIAPWANALLIKGQGSVRGVHHAAGANLVLHLYIFKILIHNILHKTVY